jgi:hypothetical protein
MVDPVNETLVRELAGGDFLEQQRNVLQRMLALQIPSLSSGTRRPETSAPPESCAASGRLPARQVPIARR